MPSDLQITNIRDQANANSAITIASDGQITVNQNNPTLTLGSNASFSSGHIIKAHYFQHTIAHDISSNSNSFTIPADTTPASCVAIQLYSQTIQITGITATQNNKLIINANAGDIFATNDGTYQTNHGFLIDGTYYNCSSNYWHQGSTYGSIPFRPMMVFTVPASFTNKTIAASAFREAGGSGTFTIQARGATSDAGYNMSMSVLEVQT